MTKPYTGENGLTRDYMKLRYEREFMVAICATHYRRFMKSPFAFLHAMTNVFVEEARVAPYYTGHREMLLSCFVIGLGIYSWVQVFSAIQL